MSVPLRHVRDRLATTPGGLATVALVALCAASCDGQRPTPIPTAPTVSSPPPSLPPGPFPTVAVSGRVLDDAAGGVPGASLKFSDFVQKTITTTADGTGAFSATVAPFRFGFGARVEKAGYEPAYYFVSTEGGPDVRRDLHLYPPLRFAAGASVQVPIQVDDPICGSDDEFRCRTVRITAASTGALTVEVSSDGADAPVSLGMTMGFSMFGSQLLWKLEAGSELVVDVLVDGRTRRDVLATLHTTFEPD
jgi:hypothetical protein